jgi:hypothetical protein
MAGYIVKIQHFAVQTVKKVYSVGGAKGGFYLVVAGFYTELEETPPHPIFRGLLIFGISSHLV